MTLLKINRPLLIYISIGPLKFEVDIKAKVKLESGNQKIQYGRQAAKWHRWESIGYCLWPPSTCIWNLKLKFQSKLDLCSGNHVVYRQTDGRTDGQGVSSIPPPPPPPTSLGGGIKTYNTLYSCHKFSAGSRQATRGSHICETSLLQVKTSP